MSTKKIDFMPGNLLWRNRAASGGHLATDHWMIIGVRGNRLFLFCGTTGDTVDVPGDSMTTYIRARVWEMDSVE